MSILFICNQSVFVQLQKCFFFSRRGAFKPRGGTLIFSAYVGSDPASTVHPKKYQKFQAPQKNIWNFCNPKKYPDSVYLPEEKTLKYIEITPKTSPIFGWPQKNIHKIFIPKKIFIFLKTPKNIEIQKFDPKKMVQAYVYTKISEYPPWAYKWDLLFWFAPTFFLKMPYYPSFFILKCHLRVKIHIFSSLAPLARVW